MNIYFKKFTYYFIRLLILLIFVKIFIITWLIARGEWPASFGFLLSIVQWDKEALKILGLATLSAVLTAFSLLH